jgi:hypothetical protein
MTSRRRTIRRAAALALLTLTACGRSMPAEPAAVQVALGDGDVRMDPARIVASEVRGDLLRLEVQYGGGCAQHHFQLHMKGGFLESEPVQARLQLAHDAGGDVCRALLGETLEFDLSPLRRAYEHAYPTGRVMVLLLQEPGAGGALQPPLRYEL